MQQVSRLSRGIAGIAVFALPLAVAVAAPTGRQAVGIERLPLIPWPASVEITGEPVSITKDSAIEVTPGHRDLARIGQQLSDLVRPALDGPLVVRETRGQPASGAIVLEIVGGDPKAENYEIQISAANIRISAPSAAGVFYGVQTLRQLLPASVESRGARPHALTVPAGRIVDRPRFGWRGAMVDVARHFFGPREMKRYIDLLALHKFNRLHLGLSNDQGWRIEIAGWPRLTTYGSTTSVGGGPGGFYSRRDYADLIAYAAERFITVVPEIDMPSHINAALSSYPTLNCDGKAPPLYTGIEVGFSTLCMDKPITYRFIDDVVKTIAAMTPGPYVHIGGDEVKTITPEQYKGFMERVQAIVARHGKTVIAWDEITHATLLPSTIVQYWRPDASITPPAGTKLILSPANKIYLDMKYFETFPLGLKWAGYVDVSVPYEWDPATLLPAVPDSAVLGVESAIWTETLVTMDDLELMAFPRIAAVAEVAWSPQAGRQWSEFRQRLGAQGPRWSALGINAYWSPKIDWRR